MNAGRVRHVRAGAPPPSDFDAPAATRQAPLDFADGPRPAPRRRVRLLLAVLLLIAAGCGAFYTFFHH